MPPWPWTQRTFEFDFPSEKFPDIMERFRGTPARLEDRVRGLPGSVLTWSDGGWSVLQNIGHLLDTEYLPACRLEELLAGRDVLTAADITNRRTHEAQHNARDVQDLLSEFRRERLALCSKFEALAPAQWSLSARHPRLQQAMRTVDLVFFTCEHDDYHLARISALIATATQS